MAAAFASFVDVVARLDRIVDAFAPDAEIEPAAVVPVTVVAAAEPVNCSSESV